MALKRAGSGIRCVAAAVVMLLGPARGLPAAADTTAAPPTYAELLDRSPPSDWRRPDPSDLLYVDLDAGRVVILLAPDYAPVHVARVRALARAGYYDGLSVMRVQDDYVAQWGGGDEQRALPAGMGMLRPEFDRALGRDVPFTRLVDGDVYAPEVGHSRGMPVARDRAAGRTWLAHCYGMVGVGRDLAPDSATGQELYAVIGHAPRHLDRNVTLIGRVLTGIELLSSLPRGHAAMGFYGPGEAAPRVRSVRLAADVPAAERVAVEVFDTESPDYGRLVEARRNRRDAFFHRPAGRIDLCNAPLPARFAPNP